MQWDWSQNDITFDQNCWTFDGYNGCAVVEPPPPSDGGGRGSGPTHGIRHDGGYRPNYQDVLDQIERERIETEDNEIIELIMAILTKGIL